MLQRSTQLIVFHPSPFMVEVLDQILAKQAPEIEHENLIVPDLLDQVMLYGMTSSIKERVRIILERIPYEPNRVVLCSCSTVGGCAEEMQPYTKNRVLRIDRPMAEAAVAAGRRIGVAAALRSTIGPTFELLREVSSQAGQQRELIELYCENAWKLKQKGDDNGYIADIVSTIEKAKSGLDVVVLAQGSMAPAEQSLAELGIKALSSPRLAIARIRDLCGGKVLSSALPLAKRGIDHR